MDAWRVMSDKKFHEWLRRRVSELDLTARGMVEMFEELDEDGLVPLSVMRMRDIMSGDPATPEEQHTLRRIIAAAETMDLPGNETQYWRNIPVTVDEAMLSQQRPGYKPQTLEMEVAREFLQMRKQHGPAKPTRVTVLGLAGSETGNRMIRAVVGLRRILGNPLPSTVAEHHGPLVQSHVRDRCSKIFNDAQVPIADNIAQSLEAFFLRSGNRSQTDLQTLHDAIQEYREAHKAHSKAMENTRKTIKAEKVATPPQPGIPGAGGWFGSR